MDREIMSNEENYCFDVAGYLIVRDALTPKEIEACNNALHQTNRIDGMLGWPAPLKEPFRALLVHPVLGGISTRFVAIGSDSKNNPN